MAHTVEESPVAFHADTIEVCNVPEVIEPSDTGTGWIFNITANFYRFGIWDRDDQVNPIDKRSEPIFHTINFPFKVIGWNVMSTTWCEFFEFDVLYNRMQTFVQPLGTTFQSLTGINFLTLSDETSTGGTITDLGTWTKTTFQEPVGTEDAHLFMIRARKIIKFLSDSDPDTPPTTVFSLKCERL